MARTSQKRRLAADGGEEKEALVLADETMRSMQWHRVEFDPDTGMWSGLPDGYETVCGRQIDRDDVRDIEYDAWSKVVAPRNSCGGCRPEVDRPDIATDGGLPRGHGREYQRQQARDHRAMERRHYLLDGRTSTGRRL